MYLSRIALDMANRGTMKALASPNIMHGLVERSFSGEKQRRLWRIDKYNEKYYLLILSMQKPHLVNLVNNIGFPDLVTPYETKSYTPLLDYLRDGQEWQFRLCANPVRSVSKEKGEPSDRGKLYAHVTIAQQKQWLLSRAEEHGFKITDNTFDVIQTDWMNFDKGSSRHRVTIRSAVFEGWLTISELERFKKTLTHGLGRAKAYGCGLLTIAPIRIQENE